MTVYSLQTLNAQNVIPPDQEMSCERLILKNQLHGFDDIPPKLVKYGAHIYSMYPYYPPYNQMYFC